MPYVHCIPARYVMAILLLFGTIASTILRVNINVIVPVILNDKETKWDDNMNCTKDNSSQRIKVYLDRYSISRNDETLVMSAFYWGYCLSGLVAGYMAEQWGPIKVTSYSTMCSALLTIIMPIAYQKSMTNIAALRLIIGLGEGVILICCKKLIISWSPLQERRNFCYILYGSIVATVISYPLFGLLLLFSTWSTISYTVGSFAFVWALMFLFLGGDDPSTYKYITAEEREYIESNQVQNISFYSRRRRRRIPWQGFLSSECVWALLILLFTNSWNLFFFTDYLPLYLNRAVGMPPYKAAILAAIPIFFRGIASFPSVWISKRMLRSRRISVTTVRKIFTFFSHIVPGILLQVLAAHPDLYTSTLNNLIVITTITFFNGNIVSGGVVNTMDLSPHLAGSLYTILYNFSNLSGMIMPFSIAGFITAHRTITCGWNCVLTFLSAMYLFGGIIFLCMGSGKEQPWDAEYVKMKYSTVGVVPEGVSSFYHRMHTPSPSESVSVSSKYSAISAKK